MVPSSLQVGFMSFIVGGSALWYRLDELLWETNRRSHFDTIGVAESVERHGADPRCRIAIRR